MKPQNLILRCYAEQKGASWQAFCLDLNLAVQGSTRQEVKRKLHEQIGLYLYEALEGEDQAYAHQLLNRKAPIGFWMKYYLYKSLYHVKLAHDGIRELFNEVMPVSVSVHLHHA
ncbi:MAG: hypothetical protein A2076_01640 [Geobacteraceae bacterium GWC2_53_11]|nr:MAG: hypothetical protein A2076_01640 [Geobacteraceae bacterium GWC2_53_11]